MKCFHRLILGLATIALFSSCSAYRASVDAVSSAASATASAVGSVASKAMDAVTPGSSEDTAKGDWNDAVVTIELNGSERKFIIHLQPELAPKHVANFKNQVKNGTYSGLAIHRAIRSYLVQMGDPLTKDDDRKADWGTGGETKKVPSETGGKHNRGAVAMAKLATSVNPQNLSSGSQFYIMLRSASNLDADYTVFGEVTQGLDVIEKAAAVTVDSNDVPTTRIDIKSVKLVPPSSPQLNPTKTAKRVSTQSDNDKGGVTKFIERIW